MIRVLFYTSYPPASFKDGGGALAIWYGVQALARQPDIDLTIVYPVGHSHDPSVEGIAPEKLIPIGSEEELPGLLEKLSPDVFHTMRSGSIPALQFCRERGIPAVYEVRHPQCYPSKFVHKLRPPYHRQWREMLAGRQDRKAARLARHVIVPSRTALENLRKHYGIPENRSGFFYNGIDFDTFHPGSSKSPENAAPVIVNAGRIERDRNFDLLIRVYYRLKELHPEISLHIAGDGSRRAALEEESVKNGISGITFHGTLPHQQLAGLYRSSDLLLNASQSESFGNVVAEAMACGLPVVCFEAGSLVELVEDGQTGLLCALLDEEDLFQKAAELLANRSLLSQMGSNAARSTRQRFSWTKRAGEVALLYHSLL